jgi:uncharacterized membrane protein
MADKNDILKKLNELLKKSEELQNDLRQLNQVILYSDVMDEKTPQTEPVVKEEIKKEEPLIKITPPEIKPEEKKEEKKEEFLKINIPKVEHVIIEQKKPQQVLIPQKQNPVIIPPKQTIKKAPAPSFFEKNPDLEKFIGERLLTFIGIAVLVIGIAFFVKYAIDQDWINEIGRTFIGILSGAILIGVGHRLRRNFSAFSSVLIGGGIAVEYFTISYAHHVYHLFGENGQLIAFLLLVTITAFTVLLSVAYDRKELAIIAIIGGFCSPLMVASSEGKFIPLCSYILILNLGMLSLAYFKKWNVVNIISYVFTVLLFGGAIINEVANKPDPAYQPALVFATLYYLTFFLMNVVNNLKQRTNFKAFEIIALLSNTCLYYAAGYFILEAMDLQAWQGLFTLLVAVFNCVFAFLLYKRQEIDKNLVYFLIGIVLTFISLTGPVQLEGNNITIFWAAETVMLFWLYQRSGIKLLRTASWIVNALMLFSLVISWVHLYFDQRYDAALALPLFLNRAFLTGAFVSIAMGVMMFLYKKETEKDVKVAQSMTGIFAIIILYFTFFLEFAYQLARHGWSGSAMAVMLCTYNSLFMLTLMLFVKWKKLEHLAIPSMVLGFIVCVLYFILPHIASISVRNGYLEGTAENRIPYLLHYLNTAIVAGILTFIFIELKKMSLKDKALINSYLWFLCISAVFIVSAELDHLQVMSRYLSVGNVDTILEQSHKIAYPIAWGICSFIMIVIGMRRQSRQLRIISLSLFFITVVKLISLGVWGESEAGKIIAFISSGVLLLVVAFMYQRLKKILTDEDKINEQKDTNA